MTALKDLLGDVAEQAKLYDVTDRAVRVARRRRRRKTWLTPVSAGVVLAAAVTAVWLPLSDGGGAGDADPAVVMGPLGWLPERLDVPDKVPPPLPADRPVGLGSVLYTADGRPGHTLVTADGLAYGVERSPQTLSPDGRWLLRRDAEEGLVRDLTGTTELTVGSGEASRTLVLWSPDSAWLAWVRAGYTDADITVTNLRTAERRTVPLPPGTDVAGLLPSGDLILRNIGLGDARELLFVDSATGKERRRLVLDVTAALTAAERGSGASAANSLDVLPDGRSLLIRTWINVAADRSTTVLPDDFLVVDAETGKVTRRYPAPDPTMTVGGTPVPNGSPWSDPTPSADVAPDASGHVVELRDVVAVVPQGVLLYHNGATTYPVLEFLDLATGQISAATEADGRLSIRIRGFTG